MRTTHHPARTPRQVTNLRRHPAHRHLRGYIVAGFGLFLAFTVFSAMEDSELPQLASVEQLAPAPAPTLSISPASSTLAPGQQTTLVVGGLVPDAVARITLSGPGRIVGPQLRLVPAGETELRVQYAAPASAELPLAASVGARCVRGCSSTPAQAQIAVLPTVAD